MLVAMMACYMKRIACIFEFSQKAASLHVKRVHALDHSQLAVLPCNGIQFFQAGVFQEPLENRRNDSGI